MRNDVTISKSCGAECNPDLNIDLIHVDLGVTAGIDERSDVIPEVTSVEFGSDFLISQDKCIVSSIRIEFNVLLRLFDTEGIMLRIVTIVLEVR